MRLLHASGDEVRVGDKVTDSRGGTWVVTGWQRPLKPSSTGRVYVKSKDWTQTFFPSVFDMEWDERTDR